MGGRFANDLPRTRIKRMFGTSNPLPNVRPSWNVAPTIDVPVVWSHPETHRRHGDLLKWGLVPFNPVDLTAARKPINARSETVATSSMFRAAVARRRCIVPATAFYEWKTGPDGKQPFAIAMADRTPLAFAGVWEGCRSPSGDVVRTFAILTIGVNATMSVLHGRMPVSLEPEDWHAWLDGDVCEASDLLRPAVETALAIWPVSKAVGNVRNDSADLLAPHRPAPARRSCRPGRAGRRQSRLNAHGRTIVFER